MIKRFSSDIELRPLLRTLALAAGVSLAASKAGADSQLFTAGAGQTWTAPAGVTSVRVECWGAGGAGGSASNASSVTVGVNGGNTTIRGGGGGGGGYIRVNSFTVTPGVTYTFDVPAGALPVDATAQGLKSDGSNTIFTNEFGASVIAKGGLGGGSCFTNDTVTPGNGLFGFAGTSQTQTGGDAVFQGGNGAVSTLSSGGCGGGGAGDSGSGANGVPGNSSTGGGAGGAGAPYAGGKGGNSRGVFDGGGIDANDPGGGGGSARASVAGAGYLGGAGGDGQIVLTWVVPSTTLYRSVANGNWNDTATWNTSTDNGATWGAAATVPDETSPGIFITNGFTVTVDFPSTASALSVASGSRLVLAAQLNAGVYIPNLLLNGVLENALSSPDSQTFVGVISGSGSVTNSGTGTLILAGVNTYTGLTGIGAGTVQISGVGQLGSGTYAAAIINNGVFGYSSSAAQTLNGLISGSGLLNVTGSGTLTLPNANTHIGGTTLGGGKVRMGNNGALGTGILSLTNATTITSIGATDRTITNNVIMTGGPITIGDLVDTGKFTFSGVYDMNNSDRTAILTSDMILTGFMTNSAFNNKRGPATFVVKGQLTQSNQVTVTQGDVLVDGGQIRNNGNGWRLMNTNGVPMSFTITNGGSFIMTNGFTGSFRLGIAGEDTNTTSPYVLNVYGTMLVATTNPTDTSIGCVYLGNAGGKGTMNLLTGGLVRTICIRSGGIAESELNLDGGTLIPAYTDITNFLEGLTNAYVKNGGVTVDTEGLNTTINQNLQAGGTGGLTKKGLGTLTLGGTNTYTGNTVVNGGMLNLTNGGQLQFVIGNNGVNNQLNGNSTGSAILDGMFYLDVSAANTTAGNSWTLVNKATVATIFGGTFAVKSTAGDFTESANVWTLDIGGGKTLSFSESTGVLTVTGSGPSLPGTLTNSVTGGGTLLSLSWPTGGWRLQQQTNALSKGLSTNWVDVTPGSATSTNITIDKTRGSVFYRLTYP